MGSRNLLPWLLTVMVLVCLSNGDLEKDKEKCGQVLIGLGTCFPYVQGEAKAPTMACCNAAKPLLQTNKVCLCILIKDRDDPNLGVKFNATLALGLPDKCHLASNISECPQLLNLTANSPEAKIFEDYGKNDTKSNTTTTTVSPPGNASNGEIELSGGLRIDGGKIKWLGVEKILGVFIIILMFLFRVV